MHSILLYLLSGKQGKIIVERILQNIMHLLPVKIYPDTPSGTSWYVA
ncbi:hypothetical protein SAMN02745220_01897 [Desulfopila aestuarii DSM 18488]|uniref:Uncharacterized protein n=1 Tax=Desulfopila aestuarii DSM 18488 TaxID=1121416 RepID=A0A1M7Y584_9BACT|nr:hypothetical protein SAMN02745220_01897 [Desulfopila aestuarii DSM 18488]